MADQGKRRSDRVNRGQPPDRFGNPILSQLVRRSPAARPEDIAEDPDETLGESVTACTTSQRSLTSVSSQVRQLTVDVRTTKEVAALDEQFDARSREITLMEFEVQRLREEVKSKSATLQQDLSDENKTVLLKELEELESIITERLTEIGRGKIDLDYEKKAIERKKTLIMKEADLEKVVIQEDDEGSQRLSNPASITDKQPSFHYLQGGNSMTGDKERCYDEERFSFYNKFPPVLRKNPEVSTEQKNEEILQWALTSSLINIGAREDIELRSEQEKFELEGEELKEKIVSSAVKTIQNFHFEDADKIKKTDEVLQQQHHHQSSVKGDDGFLCDADRALFKRYEHLKSNQFQSNFSNQATKANSNNSNNKSDRSEKSNIEQLADVLAQAFKKVLPQQSSDAGSSDTRTLLARQVQGRDLPTFSGRPEEWPAFVTAYESSTKNCKFSNADNLTRLQKCLKDEAKKTVQCLLISPESVPKVMEKLKMRFGRPQQIIEALINKIREVPAIKSDKFETFIDFGIAVDNLTSTIQALDQKEHLTNPMLITELIKKLPHQSQIEWVRYFTILKLVNPNLEDFAAWLSSYTEAACVLCPAKSKPEEQKSSSGRNPQRSNHRSFTMKEENTSTTTSERRYPEKKCVLCEQAHRIVECSAFKKEIVESRNKIASAKRLCYGCLNLNHMFKDCRTKRDCNIDGCKKKHHRLLHSPKPATNNSKQEEEVKTTIEEEEPQNISHCAVNTTKKTHGGRINVGVIPVRLRSPYGTISTFAELDHCATVTTLDSSISSRLGLRGAPKSLTVKGFQSTTTILNSEEVELEILPDHLDDSYKVKAKTVNNLDLAKQSLNQSSLRKWKHLMNVDIRPYENARPTILIGLDNSELLIPREVKCGPKNAPFAIKTLLGWVLMGKLEGKGSLHSSYAIEEQEDFLHKLVKDYFTMDSFGIMPNQDRPRSREDARAQEIMDKTLKRVSNGWETGLLWREDNLQLPESKSVALRRLYQMERRMDADPEFARQYVEKIKEYQAKGFARLLSNEEAIQVTPKTYYLPHFMALNPKKPKKLRFVFDAASKSQGKSLNDFLLQGPDKLTSLPGVLLKFRQRKIGFTADIEDMFHRVRVNAEDAQAQRFLWRGLDRNKPPETYEMGVLIFGASCSPACAQEAKNKNALEYKEEFPDAYDAIVKRHYVDDLLDSVDTPEQAVQRFNDVREVHSRGGFNIRNCLSNSTEFLKKIPDHLWAKSIKSLDFGEMDMERVLGLFWRPEADAFTFNLTFLREKEEILRGIKIPTKSEMLSLTMSIYDPLGFVSILTIKARIILQQTWRSQIDWKDEIPASSWEQWKMWICELGKITEFSLPRCYSLEFSTADEVQLHVFCDASEEAFGAAAYFRIKKNDQIETAFVMAKSKVAPMKTLSIPRLELKAAVMGSRLANFIREEHEVPINRTVYWTDSRTVVCWLRSDSRRFHQFVSHRVGEIQELTNINEWMWVPTNQNVADELTRFMKPCDWKPKSRWVKGPDFLSLPENEWPQEPVKTEPEPEESEREMKKHFIFRVQSNEPVIDVSRYSSWPKLLRITAYVKKYLSNLKSKIKGSDLKCSDMAGAEKVLLKQIQKQSFGDDYGALLDGKEVSRTSRLLKLNPYLDEDGIMRVKGRIDNASVSSNMKRPAVLDPKHPAAILIVQYYHRLCGHHGQERIVNELRQKFYILHIRVAVKAAQFNCQICKNYRSKPVVPMMGQMPSFRLQSNVTPFMKTGVDYFGPIEVIVKRSKEKRYGVLFTCLSTRAIHLEIAHALTTDSCILAIRRFVGRRGCPVEMHSDNGTNFHGAATELKTALRELNQEQLKSICSARGIDWHFIPPAAPHMGGSWERMVRAVKVALGAVLNQKNLHDEVLQTLFIEAEHTVNSHPLTHVPDDPDDSEALTPNHFLIGRSSNLQPMGKFEDEMFGRKQWRIVQQMANCFWRRWIKEYLPTLLRRQKWNRITRPIKEGDVVVEVDENQPRNSWPKGIVIKTYPGEDQVIRVVDIRHGNGQVYKRPVSKLCILDVLPKDNKTESASVTVASAFQEKTSD